MLACIESEAARRQITGTDHYFDNLNENIRKYFDPKNYYLDENGIAIFILYIQLLPMPQEYRFCGALPAFGDNLRYNFARLNGEPKYNGGDYMGHGTVPCLVYPSNNRLRPITIMPAIRPQIDRWCSPYFWLRAATRLMKYTP